MDERPEPDQLPGHIPGEETRLNRGRLKIFLGYAAGVGKTSAMLETAQQRREEGVDVLVGYLETHGRAETEALSRGLEHLPQRELVYRGITLTEMDLDALLARHPKIALVDELAHTNAPGSRHQKRYQDVLELLNAGIDVYTTLNIQHLESLNDVVAQITETPVRETVPDHLLDNADEMELIDLPVDELLQRLEEGKVHVPQQAEQALRHFFRPGNLVALRELSFRRAAERVDEQLRAYRQTHDIRSTWPAAERVLVCVGPGPLAERLIRTARRLAARLNAEWYAVYVETPRHMSLSEAEQDHLIRALRLAESLGGQGVRLPGDAVAETIVAFAHSRNVTKIIAGKPLQPRWRELLHGSIVEQLIRLSQEIDVYVISSADARPVPPDTAYPYISQTVRVPADHYLRGAGLVLLVTLLGLPLRPFIDPSNVVMLYLLAVVLAALRLGRAPAVFTSLLSVLAFDLIFIPPFYTLAVADAQYVITFIGLLGVGLVISSLAARARQQTRAAQRREAHTAALYEFGRELAAVEFAQLARVVVTHVERTMGTPAAVFIGRGEHLALHHASPNFTTGAAEQAVAFWTFKHNEPAGRGTHTLAGAEGYYLPMQAARRLVGVLGVNFPKSTEADTLMTAEQRRLLESFTGQAAVAIENMLLGEKAQEAQLLRETEKLQAALLNSISHELRTPLASITGALSSLRDDRHLLDERAQQELVTQAYEEAERLNSLVGNLLDMTRLEAGALIINAEPVDLEDVVGVALSRLTSRLEKRRVIVEIPGDLPLVSADFVLLAQALVNLIDNANKYTSAEAPITIRGRQCDNELLVQVLDQGSGVPEEELAHIFEKFYRVKGPRPGQSGHGLGLGLSISKGIIEAHHGRIWAESQSGGGTVFNIALPLTAGVVRPSLE